MYPIHAVTTPAALQQLMPEWRLLAARTQSPLLQAEWFTAGLGAFHEKDQIYVITARQAGNLVALAPLILRRRGPSRWLELIGSSILYEPSDLLYSDENALEALCLALLRMGRPTVLTRIPAQSVSTAHLLRLASGRGLVRQIAASGAPYLPVQGTWDAYLESLTSQRRYDYRRALRRLGSAGQMRFDIVRPGPAEAGSLLEIAFEIEGRGWKGRNRSNILSRPDLRHFFETYAHLASADHHLVVSLLYLDDQAIAMQIGVEFADRYWILKIGYDEAHAKASPGLVLMARMIQYAHDNLLKGVEFLGGDEPWLHAWTTQRHEYDTLVFYPFTAAGALALCHDGARLLLSRARNLVRPRR